MPARYEYNSYINCVYCVRPRHDIPAMYPGVSLEFDGVTLTQVVLDAHCHACVGSFACPGIDTQVVSVRLIASEVLSDLHKLRSEVVRDLYRIHDVRSNTWTTWPRQNINIFCIDKVPFLISKKVHDLITYYCRNL
jgi:hypothetical protein